MEEDSKTPSFKTNADDIGFSKEVIARMDESNIEDLIAREFKEQNRKIRASLLEKQDLYFNRLLKPMLERLWAYYVNMERETPGEDTYDRFARMRGLFIDFQESAEPFLEKGLPDLRPRLYMDEKCHKEVYVRKPVEHNLAEMIAPLFVLVPVFGVFQSVVKLLDYTRKDLDVSRMGTPLGGPPVGVMFGQDEKLWEGAIHGTGFKHACEGKPVVSLDDILTCEGVVNTFDAGPGMSCGAQLKVNVQLNRRMLDMITDDVVFDAKLDDGTKWLDSGLKLIDTPDRDYLFFGHGSGTRMHVFFRVKPSAYLRFLRSESDRAFTFSCEDMVFN